KRRWRRSERFISAGGTRNLATRSCIRDRQAGGVTRGPNLSRGEGGSSLLSGLAIRSLTGCRQEAWPSARSRERTLPDPGVGIAPGRASAVESDARVAVPGRRRRQIRLKAVGGGSPPEGPKTRSTPARVGVGVAPGSQLEVVVIASFYDCWPAC